MLSGAALTSLTAKEPFIKTLPLWSLAWPVGTQQRQRGSCLFPGKGLRLREPSSTCDIERCCF